MHTSEVNAPRFVLWTHSRCRWVPTLRSRDAVELLAIARDCGERVVVLPDGAVPCDA
jgi:hypothetical protein